MIHVSPMTPRRLARWVEVPPGMREALLESSRGARIGGVIVSGHLGNWELLLGANALFPGLPRIRYLAEDIAHPVFDRFLNGLRGSGGSDPARRKGGARSMQQHVAAGGAAGLLADRNVVRRLGGIWAPFLGLPARTTPLPAWLALRNDCHVRLITCLPGPDGRATLDVGPNLAEVPRTGDPERDIAAITGRVNAALEAVIRRHPEAWNWTLKRFKSRPERELGPYPPYSLWDPDPSP
jgi:KDO2-lipid IV(A) lauroyltransferase